MKSLTVIFVFIWPCLSMDIFENVDELKGLMDFEQTLLATIGDYKSHLEKTIETIQNLASDAKEVYKKEECPAFDGNCTESDFRTKVLSNPIYNYQVIRRINVLSKTVDDVIKQGPDTKKILGAIRKVRHRYPKNLPVELDLQTAAKSVNRLVDFYHPDLGDFSRGKLDGVQTNAKLGFKDKYFMARIAALKDQPKVGAMWLDEILNGKDSLNLTDAERQQANNVLMQIKRKLAKDWSLEDEKIPANHTFVLGNIPPRTTDFRKYLTADDHINYRALCKGMDILPRRQRDALHCYLSAQTHPYFILRPLKVEEHHGEPHRVVSYHNVITDKEADEIIGLAKPLMAKSSIGESKDFSEIRVSRNAWLADGIPVVDRVSLRINLITGLQTTRAFDAQGEGKKDEYEMLQVANYGVSGYYDVHQDPMHVYKEPEHMVRLGNPAEGNTYITGDRMTTFMFYLSEVAGGGSTAFPRLGVAVKPSKGSAVMWNNLKRSGRSDMHMLHGGCPIMLGTKWVANKWVREAANIFHRPCKGNIDL